MDKKVVGRAVSLVFSILVVGSTVLSMFVAIGDERPAEKWTALDALWGVAVLIVFSYSVIDIYQYHKEQ